MRSLPIVKPGTGGGVDRFSACNHLFPGIKKEPLAKSLCYRYEILRAVRGGKRAMPCMGGRKNNREQIS